MRKAIVTIVHGESYRRRWSAHALPTWRRYAARHGYRSIIVIDRPLDESERARSRSIAWQKLLVAGHPEVEKHDVAVWVDADIVMNHRLAPCVVSALTTDKVGVCEEMELPTDALFAQMVRTNEKNLLEGCARLGIPHPTDPFRRYGLSEPPERYFNTGVMVIRPREHRELLEAVYYGYEDKGPGCLYEQVPLSFEISRKRQYEVLDPKFNVLYGKFFVALGCGRAKFAVIDGRAAILGAILGNVYFLHFAGIQHVMPDLGLLDLDASPIRLKRAKVRKRVMRELESLK